MVVKDVIYFPRQLITCRREIRSVVQVLTDDISGVTRVGHRSVVLITTGATTTDATADACVSPPLYWTWSGARAAPITPSSDKARLILATSLEKKSVFPVVFESMFQGERGRAWVVFGLPRVQRWRPAVLGNRPRPPDDQPGLPPYAPGRQVHTARRLPAAAPTPTPHTVVDNVCSVIVSDSTAD